MKNTQNVRDKNYHKGGINRGFISLPNNSFKIDSKEVLASGNRVTSKEDYILIMSSNGNLNVHVVKLIEVYSYGEIVRLFLINQKDNQIMFLKPTMFEDNSDDNQDWWLIEPKYVPLIIEKLEAMEYCLS